MNVEHGLHENMVIHSIWLFTLEKKYINVEPVENHSHIKPILTCICLFTLEIKLISVKSVENHYTKM